MPYSLDEIFNGLTPGGSSAPGGYGPWEKMSPLLSRRRKPDGTWEVKLTPAFAGGQKAVTPAPKKSAAQTAGDFANRAITATAEGIVALPEILLSRREHGSTGKVVQPDLYGALSFGKPGGFFDVKTGREDIRRQYEQRKEELREADLPPEVTATLDTVAEAVGPVEVAALAKMGLKGAARSAGRALDPTTGIEGALNTELRSAARETSLPGDVLQAAPQAERRLNTALRQAVEAEIPRVRAMTPEARRALLDSEPGEAVERAIERVTFMEAKGTHAGPPAVGPQVPPQNAMRRPGEGLETLPPEAIPGERASLPPPFGRGGAGGSGGAREIGPQIGDLPSSAGDASRLPAWAYQRFLQRLSHSDAIRQVTKMTGMEGQAMEGVARERAAALLREVDAARASARAKDFARLTPFERALASDPWENSRAVEEILLRDARKMSTKATTNFADEGLKQEFQELVADNYDLIYKKARGEPRPASLWHDAEQLADDLGMTREDFLEVAPRMGDKEVSLGRAYLGGAKQEISELAKAIDSGAVPDVAAAKARLAQLETDALRMTINIQSRFSEAGRELRSGQEALEAFRGGLSRSEKARVALAERVGDELDDDMVKMIAAIDPEKDPAALLDFLRKTERPTFRDFRMSYWINSVLSGTSTMIRNLGNIPRLVDITVMRPADAAIEQFMLAPLQGRAPQRLVRETLPAATGVIRGVPDGFRKFAYVMKNGYDPGRLIDELIGEGSSKFAGGQRLPVNPFLLSQNKAVRAAGVPLTMPTRILEATDALFKTMAHTSESYAWATRKAIEEGATDIPARTAQLIREAPEEMMKAAREAARKATYQDQMSWVGSAFSAIRRGIPGGEKVAGELRAKGGVGRRALAGVVQAPQTFGEFIAPFIHISDRTAAALTNYIPGSKPGKLGYLLAKKDPAAAEIISRHVVGGVLGWYGLQLANQGKLIGQLPTNPDLKSDAYDAGIQPYSVLIGGRWLPMRDVFGPFAGPFVAASVYHDSMQVGEDPSQALPGMVIGSGKYLLDASYMETLSTVIEEIESQDTPEVGRAATRAAARVVGGFNPFSGLQRGVATAMDPRVVQPEGFVDELKAGIPGLRQTLPGKIGPRGEEVERVTGSAGGFSPIVPTESGLADPQLYERVMRVRRTLQAKRREYGRAEKQIEDADRARMGEAGLAGKDEEMLERSQALREQLPPVASPAGAIDAALDGVRELEAAIRELRANKDLPEDIRRDQEILYQEQMEALMRQALLQLRVE